MSTQQGKLARWIEARGFGFIKPETGQGELFIHISAFKNRVRQPVVGDVIFYQVSVDRDGKTRAINARIEGASEDNINPATWSLMPIGTDLPNQRSVPENKAYSNKANLPSQRPQAQRPPKSFNSQPVVLLIAVTIGIAAWIKVQGLTQQTAPQTVAVSQPTLPTQAPRFHCQGKEWCSEMTSCEEATFYLENCPNTKMDGDNDGIPCESQWC
ncbi:excalibur calcium-binding domain-containing protein [Methylophaga sp.]|uniref:excalibur calcium-binding domain-containing protein n=1 Tax=Methylophaga sp. TaxID=2024840 RepID=UPI00271EB4FB|nr:excalibur calcium-binding domain-containing protein [Methylophaga sp.]MDO8828238.1 excalibur calcium-binding domain-containing protein [Methylophaga sp.]